MSVMNALVSGVTRLTSVAPPSVKPKPPTLPPAPGVSDEMRKPVTIRNKGQAANLLSASPTGTPSASKVLLG